METFFRENKGSVLFSIVTFATVLLVATNGSLAAEISEPLYCVIQEFTDIRVATNNPDSVSVEKSNPGKPIKVIYRPLPNGKQVFETYGAGSDIEKTSLFNKGYSVRDATQYLSQENPDQAITYFGLNKGGYHIVVKYGRITRNEGGEKSGWRFDSYINVFMYCADSQKLEPTRK